MYCRKCGEVIPDGIDICSNCGTKIINADNKKNTTAKSIINNKIIFLILSALVIFIIVLCAVFFTNGSKEKNAYFANIPWGVDIERAEEMFNEEYGESGIENYFGMEGVSAVPTFYGTSDNKYNRVFIDLTISEESKYNNEKIAEELESKFNKYYGKNESDSHILTWRSENSTITLQHFGEIVILIYEE